VALVGLPGHLKSLFDGIVKGDWTSSLYGSVWIASITLAMTIVFGAAAILGRVPRPLWRLFVWSSDRP